MPPTERFWTKVDKSGECWLWTGARNQDGYGIFRVHGRIGEPGQFKRAHTFAYEEANGPLRPDQELDHVYLRGCRSRACVRPEHLEAVTHQVNMERTQYRRATWCNHGHLRAENSRITPSGKRVCRQCEIDRNTRKREKARIEREGQAQGNTEVRRADSTHRRAA